MEAKHTPGPWTLDSAKDGTGNRDADPRHAEALERRAAGAAKWEKISRLSDGGGYRDFLEGKPIHCGETLELQATEHKYDDFGGYTLYLNEGHLVRYEANLSRPDGGIILYSSIGGHQFHKGYEGWERLRWPKR